MSAPMLVIRLFARIHNVKLFSNIRWCTGIATVKASRKECAEELSLRALRKIKAFEHYQRRHKVKKLCNRNEELSDRTIYYIENGLRKVYPYQHTFRTYVKGRWLGNTILDVFKAESTNYDVNHAEEIERGSLTVNGHKVPLDFVLQDHMVVEYHIHRHEMPVLNERIEVIEDTDELLVINKPASIPVHPCGSYKYNSITKLLRHELGYDNLRTLYRLDRLTSGLLIFMKTTPVTRKLRRQLDRRELYKEYVCRVEGKFPEGDVVCNEPQSQMSYTLALHRVDPKGKPCSTTFTRLSFNGKTSVVKCVPHTGRTHQIRVHLQFLGYPIYNDPLYNRTEFGPSRGKGGIIENTPEEIKAAILKTTSVGKWKLGDNPKYYEKFGNKRNHKGLINVTGSIKEGNSSELLHNSGDKIDKCKDAADESVSMAESSKLEENVKDLEHVTCVPDHPCKGVKTDNNSEKILDVSNSCAEKDMEEKCDKYQLGFVSGHIENTLESYSDNCTEQRSESKTSSEILADEYNDKDKTRKSTSVQTVTDPQVIDNKIMVEELCTVCKHIFEDPKPADLILYLHAVRYKGPDWEYSTPLPYWAAEDFDEQDYTGTK